MAAVRIMFALVALLIVGLLTFVTGWGLFMMSVSLLLIAFEGRMTPNFLLLFWWLPWLVIGVLPSFVLFFSIIRNFREAIMPQQRYYR